MDQRCVTTQTIPANHKSEMRKAIGTTHARTFKYPPSPWHKLPYLG